MQNDKRLLIVIPNSSDLDNPEDWQSINEYEKSLDTEIIKLGKGSKLLGLLEEIGAITLNEENNRLIISSFYSNNEQLGLGVVSCILGFLAEALIVDTCNNNPIENRKWANIARCFPLGFENLDGHIDVKIPDDYIAIGRGLGRTFSNPITKRLYSRTAPNRDICWIHKDNSNVDLLMANSKFKGGGALAGLQIKISTQRKGYYVFHSIINKMYNIPVVYFDLGNDFAKVRERLIQLYELTQLYEQDKKPKWFNPHILDLSYEAYVAGIDQNFLRGRDIDSNLHKELIEYSILLKAVFKGRIKLEELVQQVPQLNTALGMEYAGRSLKLNLPDTPIITVAC
ncbi:MAG: hypothetical protein WA919_28820 [Coleofasciculaceae cyanobacterium]